MKLRVHRELAERIREGCEGRLNVRIHPRWFALGNIYPDCTHQRFLHMHELGSAGNMVGRMVRRFCARGVFGGQNLSRWRSLRLGIVMHYISDFSCYAHTAGFSGNLRVHRAYEQEQAGLPPRMGHEVSFYGAESADDIVRLLSRALREREDYSPQRDVDYALTVGTEMAVAMLRVSMYPAVRPPLRFRLPVLGRYLLRRAAA